MGQDRQAHEACGIGQQSGHQHGPAAPPIGSTASQPECQQSTDDAQTDKEADRLGVQASSLDQVERKVDALPAALQKLTTVDDVEKRLDRVESKLDKLLIVLEKIEAKEPQRNSKPATPNSSRAQESKRESSKNQALPAETESVSRRTK